MNRLRPTPLRLLVALAALALGLAAHATAATTAKGKPQTGTWAGKVSQELGLDEPYVTKLVISVYKGRVVGLAARIRMLCDDDAVTDALVSESWRIGKGPKLTPKGSFALTAGEVALQGNLGLVLAEGTVKARTSSCQGDGFWKAKRVKI